jgi:hypothetical protein
LEKRKEFTFKHENNLDITTKWAYAVQEEIRVSRGKEKNKNGI